MIEKIKFILDLKITVRQEFDYFDFPHCCRERKDARDYVSPESSSLVFICLFLFFFFVGFFVVFVLVCLFGWLVSWLVGWQVIIVFFFPNLFIYLYLSQRQTQLRWINRPQPQQEPWWRYGVVRRKGASQFHLFYV